MSWEAVCPAEALQPGRGVAALLGERQVALFRTDADTVYAIDNVDPCTGVAVLSRGLVGDRDGEPVVASPLHKQAFSLVSGRCLDEPGRRVGVHRVRLSRGIVQVEVR